MMKMLPITEIDGFFLPPLLLYRRPLFRQSGVMNHDPSHGQGKQQVRGQRSAQKKGFHGAENACDVFIEPVMWMADVILTIEGKVRNLSCCRMSRVTISSILNFKQKAPFLQR